jgi:hypothetical protein
MVVWRDSIGFENAKEYMISSMEDRNELKRIIGGYSPLSRLLDIKK